MTIKIRRLIFYSLIAIFIVLAFIIIPYSNGWIFDFKTFTFAKLGGLYLETDPIDAQIVVDGLQMQIKPGFLKSGILIANLFPKTYHVSVTKQDYQSWSRDVVVKSSLVTQIHPIVLLPEKLQMDVVAKNVKNIFLNSQDIAWQDTNNSLKVNGNNIRGGQFVSWLGDNKFVLTIDKPTGNYFAVNVNDDTALNINLILKNLKDQKSINDTSKINKIIPYSSDGNKIVLESGKYLYLLDFNKPSIDIIKNGAYDPLVAGNGKVFFSDSKNLYSYDLNLKSNSIIAQKGAISAEISPNNQFLAFSAENKLFLFDQTESQIKLIELANDPAYFKFSPDSKKLAVVSKNSWWINIYFIGDDSELFGKKPMDLSSFEVGTLDTDLPISWYNNSSYMFLKYSNSLDLLEIDDKNPPENIQLVKNGINKYFYNQKDNLIYLLIDSTLYKAYQ